MDRAGGRRRRRRHPLGAGRRGGRRADGPLRHLRACAGPAGRRCARERDTPGIGPEQGAFATYKLTAADELLALPDGLDPRAAALAEPLAVALHGITRSGVRPGQRVLVLGAGPIGALSIAALRALGVDDVACAEPGERRQALARRWAPRPSATRTTWSCRRSAEPGLVVDGAVDVVLECSGKAVAMEAGLAQLVRGGTLVLVGAGIEPPRFDPNRILLNELVVTGAFTYDQDGFEQALALLASGRLPVDTLLEPEVVPLDGLLDAMRRPRRGAAGRKGAGATMTGPEFAKPPRFNHVAMSVPGDLLDADGRDALAAFYGDVFGFEEYQDLTQDRQRLVFRAHSHEQFVFLIADDEPMTAPRLDHFGLSVSSLARRLRGGGPAGGGVEGAGARRGRPHRADGRGVRRGAAPPQLLRALPPAPHGRDPALRVPVVTGRPVARQ